MRRRTRLYEYPLDALARVGDVAALLGSERDAIYFPDGPPRRSPGWPRAPDAPYIMLLRDATIYPKSSLPAPGSAPSPAPAGLSRKDLHLVVSQDGGLLPDAFAKSFFVPGAVDRDGDGWAADLPRVRDRMQGRHLFAEMIYGHFGHAIVDMPARLWPLATAGLDIGSLDGVAALPMLGVTEEGGMPRYTSMMVEAMGVPEGALRFVRRPVRVEQLIIARRAAPYRGRMDPAFNTVTQTAGRRLAARSDLGGDLPERLYLSRSRLRNDPRGGAGLARLDDTFRELGFEVVHPQELPLPDQIALVRRATHIAGPIGSQTHLCAFSETPGLKLLSVGPDYFELPINSRILAGQGGTEAHFLLPCPRPQGPRDRAPWTFDPADLPRLRDTVADWLR